MTLRLISWASDWLLDGLDGLVQVFGWLLGSQLSHSTFFSLLFYTYVPFLGLSMEIGTSDLPQSFAVGNA
jgi:hypothetical protein